MKILTYLFCILLLSISVLSQTILTNNDVIEMVKSGLSNEVIVAKIRASETKFDTSTDALKSLSESKVPDVVVVAMLETNKKQADADESKPGKKIPEQGNLVDIIGKERVYILTDHIKARDIIIKTIGKKLTVVDKLEDSDFVIRYEEADVEIGAAASVYGNAGTVRKLTELVGNLTVMMPPFDPKTAHLRMVYATKKSKYYVWENQPAESTTKQFLKDLGKAKK